MTDLEDRLLEATFNRGIGSYAAVYLAPGEPHDGDGPAVRVIVSSRDEANADSMFSAELKQRVSILQIRVSEAAAKGIGQPPLHAVFRIDRPGHPLHGELFQVDDEPMRLTGSRKVWTCRVSPPDRQAGI